MKKLSDYNDNEVFDLWSDLLESASKIIADPELKKIIDSKKPKLLVARYILKEHPEEAKEILLRIDPTPLNGINIVTRMVVLVNEFLEVFNDEEIADFF